MTAQDDVAAKHWNVSSVAVPFWVSRLQERCAHFTLATVTISSTTSRMVQSGMRCLRNCEASRDSCLFTMVAALVESLACRVGHWHTVSGCVRQLQKFSNLGKKRVSSDWPTFCTRVSIGIGLAGCEIRRALATLAAA